MEDVIVIGGGPAGSTTAAFLAKAGHRVRLFEKDKFPREHVGESLLPFCYTILKDLGVLEEMEKLFVRKPTVRFLTGDGNMATNWCFSHVIDDERSLSFQVDRKHYDTLLLRNAARLGAAVHEETRVTEVDFDSDPDLVRVTAAGPDGQSTTYTARFLVDASGRSSFLANRNRWRHPNPGLERTALWHHWTGVKEFKGGLEFGASLIIYLGGEKRGWIWVFPLGHEHLTVGVVLDTFYLRDKKRAVQDGTEDWQTQVYLDELFESSFVKDLLQGARLVDKPFVEGDYSYYSDFKYGSRFAMVGDSGQFIDPIFSSGIFLSMKTASLVSGRLNEMLSDGNMDHTRLDDVYEKVNGAYALVKNLILMYYNPHTVTFAEVGMVREAKEHEDAMAAGHFFLSGDFFENNAKYNSFFNLLSDPHYFDMYRASVIQRHSRSEESCDVDPDMVIFPDETYRQKVFTWKPE